MSRVQGNELRTFSKTKNKTIISGNPKFQRVSKTWISGGSSGQTAKFESFVYQSSNFEVFIQSRAFHQYFPSTCVFFFPVKQRVQFFFSNRQQLVLQKSQIFRPLFEPCSSCVDIISFFSETIPFLEKTYHRKR